jgi:ATP-dependent DNA helicase RecQ
MAEMTENFAFASDFSSSDFSSQAVAASGSVSAAFEELNTEFQVLKPEQIEAVRVLLEGRDVFVQLPTGFGKTTILALSPLAFDFYQACLLGTSLVLCLSPLIALMEDQAERLQQMGLKVALLRSGVDLQAILETPDKGSYQILLMSPEMALNNEYIRKYIHKMANKITCVVVDEAHCVAAWWVYDGCNSAVQYKSHVYFYRCTQGRRLPSRIC